MMSACRCTNSGTRMWAMLARDPVSKLSTQIDAMAALEQLIAQMRSEESRTTRDEAGGHVGGRISTANGPARP